MVSQIAVQYVFFPVAHYGPIKSIGLSVFRGCCMCCVQVTVRERHDAKLPVGHQSFLIIPQKL